MGYRSRPPLAPSHPSIHQPIQRHLHAQRPTPNARCTLRVRRPKRATSTERNQRQASLVPVPVPLGKKVLVLVSSVSSKRIPPSSLLPRFRSPSLPFSFTKQLLSRRSRTHERMAV
ncbi:hypothetical protein CVT25_006902 [Psilocybe cyanescens]|uniref:Uncharacterized protein n=1 Tax=Psilocybe cyanescens TaxID=93625 RepID=A0A409X659_PSICY|nr:hypothetical protein CVT25_006902 [Psilocybe cyanescens]